MTSALEAQVSAPDKKYERILVGYDGSENAKRALRKAIELVKLSEEGELIIVVASGTAGIVPCDRGGNTTCQSVTRWFSTPRIFLLRGSDTAKRPDVKVYGSVEEGPPADMILAKALESKADLIVVGRRGIRDIERFLMGSVSSSVVSHSECDVLVVK